MSLDECRTAEDVRARARAVAAKRNEWRKPEPKKSPERVEVVDASPSAILVPIQTNRAVQSFHTINLSGFISARFQGDCPPRPAAYRRHSIAGIQREVCRIFGIERRDMLSSRRQLTLVWPRHIAVMLAHHLTAMSYPVIGRAFGGRDHSSMIHAVRKMAPLLDVVKTMVGHADSTEDWARAAVSVWKDFSIKCEWKKKQSAGGALGADNIRISTRA
jgi:Bacterial dnaA protein helix-turn-helix